jgi:hypothetical protein
LTICKKKVHLKTILKLAMEQEIVPLFTKQNINHI